MRRWLRKLTRRARLEREMQEELAFHVQARAEDLERSGVPSAEARRQARIEFGGMESYKEQLRETRRFGFLEDAARDMAYSWRNLRRSPIFTLSAAAAIALGIGVNTALFSLVYGLLFRPLPVRDPGTIRNVYVSTRGEGERRLHGTQYFVSFDEFQFLRSQARTAELAAVAEAGASARFAPERLHLQLASDNLLPMIGAKPVAGRFFTKEEAATPGMGAVAVLSYEAWQKYFNGQEVTGRSVVLNRTPFTIIGVADERSYGPLVLKPDLWIPLTMQAITRAGEPLDRRCERGLAPGHRAAQAEHDGCRHARRTSGARAAGGGRPRTETAGHRDDRTGRVPQLSGCDARERPGAWPSCSWRCLWCSWWPARMWRICCWRADSTQGAGDCNPSLGRSEQGGGWSDSS